MGGGGKYLYSRIYRRLPQNHEAKIAVTFLEILISSDDSKIFKIVIPWDRVGS